MRRRRAGRHRRPRPRRSRHAVARMSETRSLPVPDGLDGSRVDAALAKMTGFSRTFAAVVADAGGVAQDGRPIGKSDRPRAGAWLSVSSNPKRTHATAPDSGHHLGP